MSVGNRVGPGPVLYEVTYHAEPGAERGYVYMPGRGDPRYRQNVSRIVHGAEGNWFYSTRHWERLVRPFIERARAEQ
ncbi:hypothetical protein BH24PSE2_BH24PSE2_23410 [soil metagenome]